MNFRKRLWNSFIATMLCFHVFAQSKDLDSNNYRTNWYFMGVPTLSYDADIGISAGAVASLFYYGHGSTYPNYIHALRFTATKSTRGNEMIQLQFDSDSLINGIQWFSELNYSYDQLLNFYGTGINSLKLDVNSSPYSSGLSSLEFRKQRRLFRISNTFIRRISQSSFALFGGITNQYIFTDTINIGKFTAREDDISALVDGGFYGVFRRQNIEGKNEYNGGWDHMIIIGGLLDTRDIELNPNRGIWSSIQLNYTPKLPGVPSEYAKIILIHRQYIPLLFSKLTFAYRLSLQPKLFGKIPHFMMPFTYNTAPSTTQGGLGGKRTLRGILRNRIVGEGYAFGNLELRWKFLNGKFMKRRFYFSMNPFFDFGNTFQEPDYTYPVAQTVQSIEAKTWFTSYGMGGAIGIDENFILTLDAGISTDKSRTIPNDVRFYFGTGFMF